MWRIIGLLCVSEAQRFHGRVFAFQGVKGLVNRIDPKMWFLV